MLARQSRSGCRIASDRRGHALMCEQAARPLASCARERRPALSLLCRSRAQAVRGRRPHGVAWV